MITFEKLQENSLTGDVNADAPESSRLWAPSCPPASLLPIPLLMWDAVPALGPGFHQHAGDGLAGDHLPLGRLFLWEMMLFPNMGCIS